MSHATHLVPDNAGGPEPAATASPEPAGIYLHVPFCAALCPYCDFAVTTGRSAARRAAYVDALLAEIVIAAEAPAVDRTAGFDTIYLGGGTPSLLGADQLARVLAALRSRLPVHAGAQIYLEANPEDVTAERARDWRDLGVSTLSLGVQSLDDRTLDWLGRRHRAEEAAGAVRTALVAGLATVSLDLIYGLPGDSSARVRRELERAAALGPQHLSCYQLTVSEATLLGRRRRHGELDELGEDHQAEIFRLVHARLADLGYESYEVSNFARSPGHRSRHNRKYWRHVPYLGLGPSAHSFAGRQRWWNERRLARWQERVLAGERPIEGSEELGPQDLLREALLLGLRTCEGVRLADLAERFGVDLRATHRETLERLEASDVVRIESGWLRPTLEGLAVADTLARALAP